MRTFASRNPTTGQLIQEYQFLSNDQLLSQIEQAHQAYKKQKSSPWADRQAKLLKLADLIDSKVEQIAKLITTEMGKPIAQARGEVQKSASYCRFYAKNAENYIKPKPVQTEAKVASYSVLCPLGVIYVISPFNFPFWLCFKPIIPQIALGNTVMFRPADSTPQVGLAIESLFLEAGYDKGVLQVALTSPDQLEKMVSDSRVQGLSFTGSTRAGKIISSVCGKHLKRCVMELGGSDPLVVLKKANVKKAVELSLTSRLANCGQVCFSAKRFIVHKDHFDEFKDMLLKELKEKIIGDPMDEKTQLGPLARLDLLENLEKQIQDGLKQGATLLYGGKRMGAYYMPTVVQCDTSNPLAQDEVFGPVFALLRGDSDEELIQIANQTNFGLGAVVVTEEEDREKYVQQMDAGLVFVNSVVKSDARLPSGGIKESGFGRECGEWGMMNFANIKAVWVD